MVDDDGNVVADKNEEGEVAFGVVRRGEGKETAEAITVEFSHCAEGGEFGLLTEESDTEGSQDYCEDQIGERHFEIKEVSMQRLQVREDLPGCG